MEYVIVMDVSGDIDAEVAKQNDIRFIPMEYTVGSEMRKCEGPEPDDILKTFYDGQRSGDLTKTSQISPYMYETFLKDIFEEGKSVLYLCLSSGLSSTFQSACMAKQSLEDQYPNCNLYPVDTLAATGGMGVLLERAIRNRNNGMSVQDNYDDLTKAVSKIRHWFMVDNLMYLKRGGRISAATAVVGTALNIKPILIVNEEGKLDTVAKKRGDKLALKELYTQFMTECDVEADDVVYVVHGDNLAAATQLKNDLLAVHPNLTIRVTGLTPIIGAHTGPGMVAVCFMKK